MKSLQRYTETAMPYQCGFDVVVDGDKNPLKEAVYVKTENRCGTLLEKNIPAQPIKAKTRIGLRGVFIVVRLMIWRSPMERRILLGVLVRFVQNVMRIRTYLFNYTAKEIFCYQIKRNPL